MKITESPRSLEQRKQDVLARLTRELDIWVATADQGGLPCLVALWFAWDGESVWMSTRVTNPTGRNLRDGGRQLQPGSPVYGESLTLADAKGVLAWR